MVKVVTFFLIGMIILAMFGRLRLPKLPKFGRKELGTEKCKKCGGYMVDGKPCTLCK